MQIEYTFSEVGLCIGKDRSGKRQCIAQITGTATINTDDGATGMWEIESVDLEPLCLGQASAKISFGHPLFDFVSESIAWSCGDKIWDDVLEARRPDPDRRYDEVAA